MKVYFLNPYHKGIAQVKPYDTVTPLVIHCITIRIYQAQTINEGNKGPDYYQNRGPEYQSTRPGGQGPEYRKKGTGSRVPEQID